MKSALRSLCWSAENVLRGAAPRFALMPRIARFILAKTVGRSGVLLPVDGDVPARPLVMVHEVDGLHEHAAAAAARVVDLATERLYHLNDKLDDGLGRVELSLALAFLQSELCQVVLVDASNDVLLVVGQHDVANLVHQTASLPVSSSRRTK